MPLKDGCRRLMKGSGSESAEEGANSKKVVGNGHAGYEGACGGTTPSRSALEGSIRKR